jgi:hypothetical protein
MKKYSGSFSFEADQELTTAQLNQLLDQLFLQLSEPETAEHEAENYATAKCVVAFNEGGK